MVAFHGDTASVERDTTTAMLVIGFAGPLLGGGGFGVAVRVERQQTGRTAIGAELTAGRGSIEDGEDLWLLALRGYGRTELASSRYVAVTYGAGLSLMSVGMVTVTAHGGGAVSAPNEYVSPYLGAGLAAAIPLRRGRAFGMRPGTDPCPGCFGAPIMPTHGTEPPVPVKSELYGYGDLGTATTFGGTANQLSLDVGFAMPIIHDVPAVIPLSLADAHDF